jgi:hypothetical protein
VNYIILSPCHRRNSGRTQILSSGCIVRRLPESPKVTFGYEVLYILSHYFPYLSENYIILAPCHSRSSGHNHILSNGCIVLRLSESSNCYMWLRRTISSCLLAIVEVVDHCVHYSSHQTGTCGYEVVFSLIPLFSLLFRELYLLVSLPQ